MTLPQPSGVFPLSGGLLLGMGLSAFFDGIVLHQLLQWHHIATNAGYPADTLANLEFNTLLDGLFHGFAYALTVAGLIILWRQIGRTGFKGSRPRIVGSLLMGSGMFNLVEGTIDHHLLGLHHVNETVPRDQWIYWDLGFLAWGAVMLIVGWQIARRALHP